MVHQPRDQVSSSPSTYSPRGGVDSEFTVLDDLMGDSAPTQPANSPGKTVVRYARELFSEADQVDWVEAGPPMRKGRMKTER